METFPALLVLCARNSPVTGEFPGQRPVTQSFDVFFDLRLNKRFSKQSSGMWIETPSRSLWRHCYDSHVRHIMKYAHCLRIALLCGVLVYLYFKCKVLTDIPLSRTNHLSRLAIKATWQLLYLTIPYVQWNITRCKHQTMIYIITVTS